MVDFLFLIILGCFIIFGLKKPIITFIGYMWIDLFYPQSFSYGFLNGKPLSKIMAIACIISLLFNIRKLSFPRTWIISSLHVIFAAWITITSFIALYPLEAWNKWDWAFKTILFSLLLHFVITTKEQVEVFILSFIAIISFYILSAGIKTLFGGGGYGTSLIAGATNNGLGESSTLASIAVVVLPFILFLFRHVSVVPNGIIMKTILGGLFISSLLTIIGTQARTGLIALGAFIVMLLLKTKRKILFISITLVLSTALFALAPQSWFQRMDTMHNVESEDSAYGRIVVWKWTIDFVKSHPWGGGFHAYLANGTDLNTYSNSGFDFSQKGAKAFHSIYFEVLGEHGYVGLFLFLSIILLAIIKLLRLMFHIRNDGLVDTWEYECVSNCLIALIAFCIGSSFVGIAFRPYLYYLVAIAIILEKIVLSYSQESIAIETV